MTIKSIDDLVLENTLLEKELKKIPERRWKVLKSLANIYIMDCLTSNTKGMVDQRKRIEKYMKGLTKEFKVNNSYFKQMFNLIDSYYTKTENRNAYRKGDFK